MENNIVTLKGAVDSDLTYSHTVYGEKFYTFTVSVPRLSDAADYIPVTVSERLLTGFDVTPGRHCKVTGQFRSYNNYNPEAGNRLLLSVFAKDIDSDDEEGNPNAIFINGYICKPPVYRKTPFGREIADLLIAVNRTYNKSDYIPVIAWGRNARFCENLPVGENIRIWGRVQSRQYQKKLEDGEAVTKTAYEISVSKLEVGPEQEERGC